jgi:hypothetical protein
MSRWHKLFCTEPNVFVDQHIPHCKSCGTTPEVDEVTLQDDAHASAPIPPDEPSGTFNLWWPLSVRYRKLSDDIGNEDTKSPLSLQAPQNKSRVNFSRPIHPKNLLPPGHHNPSQLQQPNFSEASGHSAISANHVSPIYGNELGLDEFRLISLSSTSDESFPLHVSFERFKNANCPEYETVSYTWGGEDEDSTACHPVYVGPFWVVLFQTKNCLDMLRFLRPSKGIRMMWVDALCINQKNQTERTQQVSKMSEIYKQCSRVVIYLGPDLALSTPGHFASRRKLHELGEGPVRLKDERQVSLESILRRRYFQRVWVVQELILSPRAVMRIGDIDYLIDSQTIDNIAGTVPDWNWESTAAPWIQHIVQGKISAGNILDILRFTVNCQASDIWDRIYGVLALNQNTEERELLTPSYSVPAKQMFIRFFAHAIINLRTLSILFLARGLSESHSLPSWTPKWDSQESWRQLLREKQPTPSNDEVCDFIHGNVLESDERNPAVILSIMDDKERRRRRQEEQIGGLHKTWPRKHGQETMMPTAIEIQTPEDRQNDQSKVHIPVWNKDASVDPATGALSINLTHVCAITTKANHVGTLGDTAIFELRGKCNGLFLAFEGSICVNFSSGQHHLFILDNGDSLVYLILRKHYANNIYKLVCCFTHLIFAIPQRTETPEPVQSFDEIWHFRQPVTKIIEKESTNHGRGHLELSDLQRNARLELESLCVRLSSGIEKLHHSEDVRVEKNPYVTAAGFDYQQYPLKYNYGQTWRRLFPGAQVGWAVLPLISTSILENRGSECHMNFETEFLKAARGRLHHHIDATIDSGFVTFTYHGENMLDLFQNYYSNFYRKDVINEDRLRTPVWHYRFMNGTWREMTFGIFDLLLSTLRLNERVHVRTSMAEVRAWIRYHGHRVADSLLRLERVLGKTLGEVVALVHSGPYEKYELIGCPINFGDGVQGDFNVDGSTFKVNIV